MITSDEARQMTEINSIARNVKQVIETRIKPDIIEAAKKGHRCVLYHLTDDNAQTVFGDHPRLFHSGTFHGKKLTDFGKKLQMILEGDPNCYKVVFSDGLFQIIW